MWLPELTILLSLVDVALGGVSLIGCGSLGEDTVKTDITRPSRGKMDAWEHIGILLIGLLRGCHLDQDTRLNGLIVGYDEDGNVVEVEYDRSVFADLKLFEEDWHLAVGRRNSSPENRVDLGMLYDVLGLLFIPEYPYPEGPEYTTAAVCNLIWPCVEKICSPERALKSTSLRMNLHVWIKQLALKTEIKEICQIEKYNTMKLLSYLSLLDQVNQMEALNDFLGMYLRWDNAEEFEYKEPFIEPKYLKHQVVGLFIMGSLDTLILGKITPECRALFTPELWELLQMAKIESIDVADADDLRILGVLRDDIVRGDLWPYLKRVRCRGVIGEKDLRELLDRVPSLTSVDVVIETGIESARILRDPRLREIAHGLGLQVDSSRSTSKEELDAAFEMPQLEKLVINEFKSRNYQFRQPVHPAWASTLTELRITNGGWLLDNALPFLGGMQQVQKLELSLCSYTEILDGLKTVLGKKEATPLAAGVRDFTLSVRGYTTKLNLKPLMFCTNLERLSLELGYLFFPEAEYSLHRKLGSIVHGGIKRLRGHKKLSSVRLVVECSARLSWIIGSGRPSPFRDSLKKIVLIGKSIVPLDAKTLKALHCYSNLEYLTINGQSGAFNFIHPSVFAEDPGMYRMLVLPNLKKIDMLITSRNIGAATYILKHSPMVDHLQLDLRHYVETRGGWVETFLQFLRTPSTKYFRTSGKKGAAVSRLEMLIRAVESRRDLRYLKIWVPERECDRSLVEGLFREINPVWKTLKRVDVMGGKGLIDGIRDIISSEPRRRLCYGIAQLPLGR